jgi:hypothetical protein
LVDRDAVEDVLVTVVAISVDVVGVVASVSIDQRINVISAGLALDVMPCLFHADA